MTAVQKLQNYLGKNRIDAYYVSNPANVRYISRYTGDDSTLLITQKTLYFITDPRYTEQAAAECPEYTLVNGRAKGGPGKTLAGLTEENHLKTIAFE